MQKTATLIILFFLFGFTQHRSVAVQASDIVNLHVLDSFFAKLKSIKEENSRVSIVHIGDSHIQADFFTGAVRQKLQQTFGNAGRGFVFPYTIARSGGALDVKFSYQGAWQYCHIKKDFNGCNLGLAGFTVTPTFDASFSIDVATKAQTDASFNKITFLDNYGSFLPKQVLGNFSTNKENGNTIIEFEELQEIVEFIPTPEKSTLPELQGMILENGGSGVLYHALGVNGSTVSQYLRSEHFAEQIQQLDASLVVISFGTNDSYTSSSKFCPNCLKEEYRTLISRIRIENPNVAILLTTPPDHYFNRKYPNKNLAAIEEVMMELAAEENVAVWNLYTAMGGKNSIIQWRNEELARADLIHFSIPGYQLQGDMFYNAIMRGYNRKY